MTRRVNAKNAVIGVVLGVAVLLVAGVASGSEAPVIGRFQIACTDSLCYLVDTATGQVWTSGTREFRAPKIELPSTPTTAETSGYLGQWISDDPEEEGLTLRIEPGGLAILAEDDRTYAGRWRVEGSLLQLDVDDEEVLGELRPNDHLNLWVPANDGETISFRRAPGTKTAAAMALPAGAAVFLGQWMADDADEEGTGLRLEPDGRAVASERDERLEGRWRVEGSRLVLVLDDDTLGGEMLPDGRLSLWTQGREDRRFTFHKVPTTIQTPPTAPSANASGFLGQWVSDEPEEGELGLRLEPDGRAVATEGQRSYDGRWRLEGSRLFLTVDDDDHIGELLPDGRLSLSVPDNTDRRLVLKRPATEAQLQSITSAAAQAGFLGRWVSDDPKEDDLRLRIEPEGRAVATEGDRTYDGRWRVEGSRLLLSVDSDDLIGELLPDGRLSLRDEEDEEQHIAFRRVDQ